MSRGGVGSFCVRMPGEATPEEKKAKRREILGRVGRALLGKGLPVLGTAIAGPMGGAVAATIGNALGLGKDADPYEIEEAIVAADPALLVELRRLEVEAEKAQLAAITGEDKEITQRWEIDNGSDSWMARNVRPYSLAFLIVSFVLFAYSAVFLLEGEEAEMSLEFFDIFKGLLYTVVLAYFGSRGVEKVTSMTKGARA